MEENINTESTEQTNETNVDEAKNEEKHNDKPIEIKVGNVSLSKKIITIIAVVVLIAIAGIFVFRNFIAKPGTELITVSSIQDIIDIDELSTLKYYYNGIVNVQNEKSEDLYYVAYKGYVTAGINISDIKISIDEANKHITIEVPEAKINGRDLRTDDPEYLDYIFLKKSANNNDAINDAHERALKDLEEKTKDNKEILEIAHDNAKEVISGLMEPWLSLADSEFTYEVK